jgi:fatty acid synthase subunit alpha, fungi type
LHNDAAVGVLQSKEWLSWENETIPPKAGMTLSLVFRIQSQVTFKDKNSYRDVCVSGDVYMRDQLKRLKKVASVEFNQEGCQGNPAVAYLQRHGVPKGRLTPLTNEGYTISNNVSTTFTTPLSNEPYSREVIRNYVSQSTAEVDGLYSVCGNTVTLKADDTTILSSSGACRR